MADASKEAVLSYALLTTAAGPGMEGIHDGQPVLLENGQVATWLDLSTDPAASYTGSGAGALQHRRTASGLTKPLRSCPPLRGCVVRLVEVVADAASSRPARARTANRSLS